MPYPFPCSPVIREWLWKKTLVEKQSVNYISTFFDEDLQYQTIDAHLSAISSYHTYINGKVIGENPNTCLLTGIFNERLPKPSYTFIWNVEVAYLKLVNIIFCS